MMSVHWGFKTRAGAEVEMDQNVSTALELHYLAGNTKPLKRTIKGKKFSFDIGTMKQTNVGSSVQLPLFRRIVGAVQPRRAKLKGELEGRFIRSIGNGEGSAANQMNRPLGIAVLPDGNVAVSDILNLRLQIVNPYNGTFLRTIKKDLNPFGLALLPSERLLVVCERLEARLRIVDLSDGTIIRSIQSKVLRGPYDVAVLRNGHIVVTDFYGHQLHVVDVSDGTFLRSIGDEGSGANQFYEPTGVAVLSNGHVVVCDRGNRRLQIVNPTDGTFIRSIGNGFGDAANQFKYPTAVAVLRNGHVAVCDRENNRLQIVNPADGTFIRSIGSDFGCVDPSGVATLPNGRIVVCDTMNHRLQILA